MATFQVGEAFLKVTPSLAGLHKKIAAEVAGWKDLQVGISPDMRKFREKVQAEASNLKDAKVNVDADLAGFHEKVKAETSNIKDADVNVNADTTGFKEQVRAETSSIADANVKVNADPTLFRQQIAALKAELAAAQAAKLKIELDDAIARAELTRLEADLERLRAQPSSVKVDADIAEAVARISELRAQLDTLKDAKVNANIDTAAARAKIAELEAELALLAARSPKITVTVDVDSGMANLKKLGNAFTDVASKGSLMSVGIGAAIGPAITSIGQLSGALGLIPAVALGAGLALGAVVIGAQGMGEALKGAGTAAEAAAAATQADTVANKAVAAAVGGSAAAHKTATQAVSAAATAHKNAQKAADDYAASLKNLAPSAQQVVSAIIQLKPAFDGLRLDVQQHLFEGMGAALLSLGSTVLPVLQSGLTQVASGLNEAALNIVKFATSKEAIADYQAIFNNIGSAAHLLAGAVQPILQMFTDVAAVGAQFLPVLAEHFQSAATAAAAFVSHARETGQLKQWIQTGLDAVKELWGALKDVVAIIRDLAVSPGFGPNLLQAIHDLTTGIRWIIENVPGATSIVTAFFEAWLVAKAITGIAGMVSTIGTVIGLLGKLKTAWLGVTVAEEAAGVAGAAAGTGMTAGGAAGVAGAGKFASALKLLGVGVGAYIVGQGLLAVSNENTGKSFTDVASDAADTAGKLLTLDFGGVADKIGRDINRLPEDLDTAGGRLKTAWGFIQDVFSGAVVGLAESANKIPDGVRQALTPLPDVVNGALGGLVPIINSGVSNIAAAVGTLPPLVQASLVQLAPAMRGPAEAALGGLLPIITKGMQDITNQVQGLAPQVQAALAPLTPAMQQAANSAIGGMLPVISTGVTNITTAVGGITTAINAVPTAHGTTFTGDGASLLTAAAGGQAAIQGVVPDWLTKFAGDTSNLIAAASGGTGAINAVPIDHLTSLTGDNGNILGAASGATGAINAIQNSHDTTITANGSQALSAISAVQAALNGLHDKFVNVVVNTVQNIAAGIPKAHGGIVQPMAQGGVLPLAKGRNLTPMSASMAQMVPPNTWRIIGDRMQGMESFIPINRSAMSQAILAKTAELMGSAVIPEKWLPLLKMLAPILGLARGRILTTDDTGGALTYTNEPDLPASNYGPRGRRRGAGLGGPNLWGLLRRLFTQFIAPALSGAGGGQQLAGLLQQQASSLAAAVQGVSPLGPRSGHLWPHGSPRTGIGTTAGPATTAALPPGYDRAYTGEMTNSPRPDPSWLYHRANERTREQSVFHIYPRADQNEESIALMVDRRQAFSLRS
jgi:hypothetical protein